MRRLKGSSGFTLIELVIVVALLAIITYLAVPSYMNSIREGRRAEGKAAIMNVQLAQEKHRANNTTYGTLADVWGTQTASENGYYTITVTGNSATGYVVNAVGTGDQVNDEENGTDCSTLRLTVAGVAETKWPAACW